ncbi:MAG: class I SAM-dependent methyltransferase [Firmicutes bacterium]|nr:class I SAM-dependent methyltransferase [Bacillota bacterium]
MEQLAYYLQQNNSKRILDVGTGVGNFIFVLAQTTNEYDEIIGIDTSQRAIEIASNYFLDNHKVKFMKMDGKKIEYPDGYFDVVCLSNSLHHLENPQPIFNEMKRVLKREGLMIIQEMVCEPLTNQQVSHRLVHHFSAEIDRHLGLTHDDTYTKEVIEEKLSQFDSIELIAAWVPEYQNKHEFSDEEVTQLISSIDQMIDRIKDIEKKPYYQDKAELIKQYIKENGFDLATEYMFILKKTV